MPTAWPYYVAHKHTFHGGHPISFAWVSHYAKYLLTCALLYARIKGALCCPAVRKCVMHKSSLKSGGHKAGNPGYCISAMGRMPLNARPITLPHSGKFPVLQYQNAVFTMLCPAVR